MSSSQHNQGQTNAWRVPIEALPWAVLVLDAAQCPADDFDLPVCAATPRAADLFRRTAPALVASTLIDLFTARGVRDLSPCLRRVRETGDAEEATVHAPMPLRVSVSRVDGSLVLCCRRTAESPIDEKPAEPGTAVRDRVIRGLASALDTLPDGLILLGSDERVIWTNEQAQQLAAAQLRDDLAGADWAQSFPGFARRLASERPAAPDAAARRTPAVVTPADGKARKFLLDRVSINTPGVAAGGDGVTLVIARDVTEAWATGQHLRIAEAGAGIGLWGFCPKTRSVSYSDTWYTMLGYEPGTPPASMESWRALCHPDDLRKADEALARLLERDAERYDVEVRLRNAEGEYIWVRTTGEIVEFDEDGEPALLLGAHVCIDGIKRAGIAHKLAYRELKAVIDSLPQTVFIMNESGDYLATRGGQWAHGDHILRGRNVRELRTSEQANQVLETIRRTIATQRAQVVRYSRTDDHGRVRYFEARTSAFVDPASHEQRIAWIAHDRTAEVESQQRLEQQAAKLDRARSEAEASSEMKSIFLASMNHEVRTPLTSVLGFAELLREGGMTEAEQADAAEAIERNASHLMGVINTILDLTKIDAGRFMLSPTAACPAAEVRAAVETLRERIAARGIELEISHAPGADRPVLFDTARVRQAVTHLLDSAARIMRTGGVRVHTAIDGSRMRVLITDGTVPPHEPCTAESSERDDELLIAGPLAGAGLGITLTRRLARLMGGDVCTRCRQNAGSVFELCVPIEPADPADAD